ncbi:hypothetical protein V6N13_103011 [Hibiscus sabdariffa]|uniref:Uncharacterized protein n=1 Tax=Hibiscus sabdariffa TaxID=183260 RepID=A0ABR2C620_9ROSI
MKSSFMQMHLQRTTTLVGYLLQSLQSCRFDSLFLSIDNPDSDRKVTRNFLDFLSEREPVRILATVNEGLVFCFTRPFIADEFYICKPNTYSRKSSRVPILDILRRRWACWCLDRSLYGYDSMHDSWPGCSEEGYEDGFYDGC